jgi:phosphatidylinositol glycan class B
LSKPVQSFVGIPSVLRPPAAAPNAVVLICLLAVAAALRLIVAHARPNIIWADEVFQVVEPAHRLVYGNGLIAWEYVVGMRSWLFPGAIAGVLWLARLFGTTPTLELISIQVFMVAASLVPVAAAYRWGERLDGVRGGVLAAGFVTLWVDLVYFAPHPLSDVIAGDALIGGLYAALPLTTRPGAARLAIAGALFGLTLVLRVQLGPAILVAALFACGREPRAWFVTALAGALVLLASGGLDWVTLGTPFRSIWLNVWLNVVKGVSNDFGVQPPGYFLIVPMRIWGVAALLVMFQFVIGGRRFPALAAVVVAIFVTYSIFAHKEWRFVFPALPIIVTLCGIAAIEEIRDIEALLGKRHLLAYVLPIAALGVWSVASLLVALGPSYRPMWTQRRELIDAFALASRKPGLCGVELVDVLWPETPGSAALPGVPIYSARSADAAREAAGYDVAVSDGEAHLPQDLYRRVACFDGSLDERARPQRTACVWVRAGGCKRGVATAPGPNWPPFFTDDQERPRWDRIRPYLPAAVK